MWYVKQQTLYMCVYNYCILYHHLLIALFLLIFYSLPDWQSNRRMTHESLELTQKKYET